MAQEKKTNEDRLGMRISPELKQRIDHAAHLKGMPTAGFVKSVLAEAADRTIKEYEFIELTKLDREAFAEALLQPAMPSKKSIKAARRYKERLGL